MTYYERFLHTLALRLNRTVHELKRSLTLGEFYDWLEFNKKSPIGDERADMRAAALMAMYANAHRDEEKQKELYQPDDFLLFGKEPPRELRDGEVFVSADMLQFMSR